MSKPTSNTVLPVHNGDIAPPPIPPTRRHRFAQRRKERQAQPQHLTKRTEWKNHFVAAVGEFVGTTLFLLFAFGGTNVANIPSVSITSDVNTSQLLYISLCFGFSLAVNAWVFFRVSGGLFNPAVSLGLALVGAITPIRAAILTVAQILGGITGAAIIQAVLPGTLNVRTTKAGGISTAQALFLEMFLTSMLMLTILLLAAEKHKATFLAPIGIGLALFIAELVGVYYTGGSLNPARSFGPDVVLHEFASYHWIYWLGPALGAMLAAGFYKFIKFMQYETVTPDQDAADTSTPMVPTTSDKLAKGEKPSLSRGQSSTRPIPAPAAPIVPVNQVGLDGLFAQEDPASTAFDLRPDRHGVTTERLDEIEDKLDIILAHLGHVSSVAGKSAQAIAELDRSVIHPKGESRRSRVPAPRHVSLDGSPTMHRLSLQDETDEATEYERDSGELDAPIALGRPRF
ncbi:mip family channel protein [Phaffia rhodozyma]|uniref:Mip family channel protein n=1 Tax=Phaffia rhodozyma TaxID=264483 RepID=A0A0F7SLA6_PHARH|nr:mip family channel protein [Phaffia rhodozyma]